MSTMPKVSVLMPVYNAERYLAEAIESILSQTFTDWELIVINDGSTDSSKNIILSYKDKRIKYHENEKNIQLIATLNKGIDLCAGQYIARMDADDICHPNRLAKQVEFMDNHPDYILCGTNGTIIDNNNAKIGTLYTPSFDEAIKIKLLFSPTFTHPSTIFRKEVLIENKYDANFIHVEDYELWTRLANKNIGKMASIKHKLLFYRWHGENISAANDAAQQVSRNKIIAMQLERLGITSSEYEIKIHRYSIDSPSITIDIESKDLLTETSNWFAKLIAQNKKIEVYSKNHFAAYLWCRWLYMCKQRGLLCKVFSYGLFAPLSPSIALLIIKYVKDTK